LRETARQKLCALFHVARNAPREEAFYGGCPVMNLAVESDDADPKLRNAARKAMKQVIALFEQVIAEGMKQESSRKVTLAREPGCSSQASKAGSC